MIKTQADYNEAMKKYMDLFSSSLSVGITYEEKAEMDKLEKEIRASKFFK